jgi:hypothetical protein
VISWFQAFALKWVNVYRYAAGTIERQHELERAHLGGALH